MGNDVCHLSGLCINSLTFQSILDAGIDKLLKVFPVTRLLQPISVWMARVTRHPNGAPAEFWIVKKNSSLLRITCCHGQGEHETEGNYHKH